MGGRDLNAGGVACMDVMTCPNVVPADSWVERWKPCPDTERCDTRRQNGHQLHRFRAHVRSV